LIIFIDSCGDAYGTTDLLKKWDTVSGTSPTVETAGGRNGTNGLKLAGATEFFARNVPALDEYFVGVAFRLQALTTTVDVLEFNEGATNHVRVTILANGSVQVSRNGTTLGTSAAGLVLVGSYSFLEAHAVIDDAAGVIDVSLDGVVIAALSLTSQDTQNGGTGVINEIRFHGTTDIIFFDDIYVCDSTGSAPQNGMLGNTHIGVSLLGGDTATKDFPILEPATPTTHYTKLIDVPADGDASYVGSSVPADQELFTIAALPTLSGTGAVYGVQVSILARKDNEGPRQMIPIINPGVSLASGTAKELVSVYDYGEHMWQQNPDTVADWTLAEVAATVIGVEIA
jgi:hypothetical protein